MRIYAYATQYITVRNGEAVQSIEQELLTLRHGMAGNIMREHGLGCSDQDQATEMDMRFETWNIKGLYRTGTVKISATTLPGYK
jgi:hypothetical protein